MRKARADSVRCGKKALKTQAVRKIKIARQTMPNVTIEKRMLVPFLSTPILSVLVLSVNAVPLRIRHYQYTKRRSGCQRFFAMLSNFFENADPPPIDFPSADCRLGESVFRRAYAFVVSATVKRTPRCAFALTRLSRQRRSTKSLNTRIISSETTCSMRQAFSSASLGVAPTFISTFVSV